MDEFTGKILALDIASVTGWAIGTPSRAPQFGSVDCREGTHTPNGRLGRNFGEFLTEKIRYEEPECIVFEEPIPPQFLGRNTNKGTTAILYGLPMIAEEIADRFQVKIWNVSVTKIRAHFLPGVSFPKKMKGDKKKKLITQHVVAKCHELGWRVEDGDAADALAVWSCARSYLCPEYAVSTTPLFAERPDA